MSKFKPHEDNLIRSRYRTEGSAKLARELGRTQDEIKTRARQLRVKHYTQLNEGYGGGAGFEPDEPDEPTCTLPGTNARLDALRERASRGQSLWHPEDQTYERYAEERRDRELLAASRD